MPKDWGGIERYVTYLTQGLSSLGHEAFITAPPGSPLENANPGRTIPLRLNNKYDLVALANYIRLFRKNRFDIINTHFSPDYVVPAWAAVLTHQPVRIMTRHLAIGYGNRRQRQIKRNYHHIISVSDAVKSALVSRGLDSSYVTTAYAGIPSLVVEVDSPKLELDPNFIHVGIFGRLTPEKGHAELIEIIKKEPRIQLHVYGQGPQLAILKHKALNLNVQFHGFVPNIAGAMSSMDAVTMPSLWDEAFSIAALEAFSLGKVLVASPRGGLPELIQDGVTGILADPENDQEKFLASLLHCGDKNFQHSIGSAARSEYESKYTLEHFAKRVESV